MIPRDPRPLLDDVLERLLADVVARSPALQGIDPTGILLVAVSAHGHAAASVRSLEDVAREVVVGGVRRHTEIALRPRFFLEGDPARRLGTLVHELLHLDPSAPGRLLDEHRHRSRSHEAHEEEARAVAERWLEDADLSLLAPLGHHGEALMRQWRVRPVPETSAERFTDDALFLAPLLMRTPRERRTVWW